MKKNKQLLLKFKNISGKKVAADFTGGEVTSDVGVLVMRETADKIGIVKLPAYKAGHLEKIFAQEGICNPFLAPTLLAFIPVHSTGYSAGFHKGSYIQRESLLYYNLRKRLRVFCLYL